ncbi:MAG: hypothetical protein J6M02_02550 [Clostridia bacterium]|nr:hypothetical protein [Clostridia bacterium]
METVYNYLYNYFTKYNFLVPNIAPHQVNTSLFISYVQMLKSEQELPPIQVYTHNKVTFIATGIHQYLACMKLNKPFKTEQVDNNGFRGATLPLMFYNEWYRTLTNLRVQQEKS